VMTDYGCPFRCTFCVMPALGWRRRPSPRWNAAVTGSAG
jgi:radical SAM superfamily enzyme YgiQ (UPF0313 family)